MSGENKKINISNLLLIICIITICVMGTMIVKLNDKIEKLSENSKENVNKNIQDENVSNIIKNETKPNDKEILNETENNEVENELEKDLNYFVLYEGLELEKKTGIQELSDVKITDEANKKYNRSYYNYENGKYLGTTKGAFGKETYEGYSVVSNVKKIAVSEMINPISRKYTEINELPKELIDMADCTEVKIHSIDLDGDKKEEKIVCYKVDYKKGEIGDGEPQASSGILLFDENYKKIDTLVSLEEGFWAGIKEENYKKFLSLEKIEYFDIDNDGIMEIIIDIPLYEGLKLGIYKYSDGKVEGESNYKASVIP